MTTSISSNIVKQQKTLKTLASIFSFLAFVIGLGTLIGTIYLIATPRGIGGWILPAFTFLAGFIVFLFLFAFSKIISILIEISSK
ncbi:hypothetical protein OIU83_13460 [Flavobacterium sp. LS1R49]|uniref:Uncharacterized protein n=1 Tax=Flavobacterium shii TaxID=2987687 RepID=A0A9X2ZH84_9FLAO|nr:hypothetical protein [Flavobacterium shii]MCV9928671.1 hypothetical protein [Flavobacterium shii]